MPTESQEPQLGHAAEEEQSHEHDHSLKASIPRYQQYGVTRRALLRAMGILFGAELAGNVVGTGGPISGMLFGESSHDDNHEHVEHGDVEAEVERKAHELVEKFQKDHPEAEGLSEREKQLLFVDYAGVALFGHGVKTLISESNINSTHYALLGVLTKYKYDLSDEEGRHHLMAETEASTKALGIIAGTIVGAEGMNADLVAAYERETGKIPDTKDRVALMTMLSSVLSPASTTVGSATILKDVSTDLCKLEGQYDENGEQMYDHKMLAVCTSHISNLSGFVLFGDPPFIAMVEKYGFKEAVAWQAKAAFPLLVYSTLSSAYKLNKTLAERDGLTGVEARTKAMKDAKDGMLNNIGFLKTFVLKSLKNAGSYASMQEQDMNGIEIWVGEKLMDTIRNVGKLPFSSEFDVPDDPQKGMVHGEGVGRVLHEQDAMFYLVEELAHNTNGEDGGRADGIPDDFVPENEMMHRLREAISNRDYQVMETVMAELHIAPGVARSVIARLKDVQDNTLLNHSADEEGHRKPSFNVVENTFSVDRMQSAMGHNLTDVVNVFPFQAGCVPFLLTAFKHAQQGIEAGIRGIGMDPDTGVGQKVKEVAMYLLIEHFSCVADNYVGCKVGLEVFPDKPQLALISAIQGGSQTAIGNMANVAQFDLKKFSLAASVGQWRQHLDTKLVALAYAMAIGEFQKFGMLQAPEVKQRAHHTSVDTTENRRGELREQLTSMPTERMLRPVSTATTAQVRQSMHAVALSNSSDA